MTIDEVQEEIIKKFSALEGFQEMTLLYLIELGQKLPELKSSERIDSNLIKGCQSKVWLVAQCKNEKIYFNADSNTDITKGLVSLLISIYNGRCPDDIISNNLFFMEKIGMSRFIGTQRTNGFSAMINQMKSYAFGFKNKFEIRT